MLSDLGGDSSHGYTDCVCENKTLVKSNVTEETLSRATCRQRRFRKSYMGIFPELEQYGRETDRLKLNMVTMTHVYYKNTQ